MNQLPHKLLGTSSMSSNKSIQTETKGNNAIFAMWEVKSTY